MRSQLCVCIMVSVGDSAPDFTLTATDKTTVTLSDFAGQRLVIAFYPAAFTGVCTAEMCSFQSSLGRLNEIGTHVVGISVDAPFSNGAFAKEHGIQFPLLSDVHRSATKAYDVAFDNFVIEGYTVSNRAVFVVESDGSIGYAWVCNSLGDEPPYDEIINHCAA